MAYEEPKQEVFYIPDNYDDAGGVMGGRFSTRNAVEMAFICGPIAFLELKLLHFSSWQINVSIALVTILPLLMLCAFGIGGESLSQIFLAYIRYRKGRRTLSYLCFTDTRTPEEREREAQREAEDKRDSHVEQEKAQTQQSTFEPPTAAHEETTYVDIGAGQRPYQNEPYGWQKPHYNADDSRANNANSTNIRKEFSSDYEAWEAATRAAQSHRNRTEAPRAERKRSSSSNRFLNSAMKEILLRKLELGEDESA